MADHLVIGVRELESYIQFMQFEKDDQVKLLTVIVSSALCNDPNNMNIAPPPFCCITVRFFAYVQCL